MKPPGASRREYRVNPSSTRVPVPGDATPAGRPPGGATEQRITRR